MAVRKTIKTNREWVDTRRSDVDEWLHSIEAQIIIDNNNNTSNSTNTPSAGSTVSLSKFIGYLFAVILSLSYVKLY